MHHPIIYQIPPSEPMEQDNSEKEPNLTFEKDHKTRKRVLSVSVSVSDKVKDDDHSTTPIIPIIVNGEATEKKIVN